MGGMDLDPVKARQLGSSGGLGVGLDECRNILTRHGLLCVRGQLGDLRDDKRAHAGEFFCRRLTGMGQLGNNLASCGVNGSCHFPEAFQQLIFVDTELPGTCLPLPTYIGMTADDHADTTIRQVFHCFGQLRRNGAIISRHSFPRARASIISSASPIVTT